MTLERDGRAILVRKGNSIIGVFANIQDALIFFVAMGGNQ